MFNNANSLKHQKSSFVEIIYTTFIAILVALFFGLGISTFYIEPQSPQNHQIDYGIMTQYDKKTSPNNNYRTRLNEYQKASNEYNRNVSIIALILSVITIFVALFLISHVATISNGVLLGGIFTLIYSIIRGFSTDNIQYRFIIVTVGLIIALILGYIKFIKPRQTAQKIHKK